MSGSKTYVRTYITTLCSKHWPKDVPKTHTTTHVRNSRTYVRKRRTPCARSKRLYPLACSLAAWREALARNLQRTLGLGTKPYSWSWHKALRKNVRTCLKFAFVWDVGGRSYGRAGGWPIGQLRVGGRAGLKSCGRVAPKRRVGRSGGRLKKKALTTIFFRKSGNARTSCPSGACVSMCQDLNYMQKQTQLRTRISHTYGAKPARRPRTVLVWGGTKPNSRTARSPRPQWRSIRRAGSA